MTDEEIKELSKSECIILLNSDKGYKGISYLEFWQEGYKKGLAEGRKAQWHDLRKNPDDLPKRTGEYWICYKSTSENEKYYIETPYYTETKCWGCLNEVIAWCEIPKFKE